MIALLALGLFLTSSKVGLIGFVKFINLICFNSVDLRGICFEMLSEVIPLKNLFTILSSSEWKEMTTITPLISR